MVRRQILAGKVITFFAKDGRPFFVIPMGPYSCVGTTDTPVASPHAVATTEDHEFILSNINERLCPADPIRDDEIIYTRCGVRPLAVELGQVHDGKDDWTQLSRKHILAAKESQQFISIYGGKLTDCLNIGDEMIDTLSGWLEQEPLDRAQWVRGDNPQIYELTATKAEGLPVAADELFARYGDHALEVISACSKDQRSRQLIASDLPYMWGEIAHIARSEHVTSLLDCLRRRTLICHLKTQTQILESAWLKDMAALICPSNPTQAIEELRAHG